MKISVLLIALGTLISKGLGLIREMYLAQKFGAGYISDAFILAISIPTVLITSFAGALNVNYIPILSEIHKKEPKKVKEFNGLLMFFIFLISTIICVVFFLFTKPIVKLFAVGYDDEGLKYVINISRISILSIYFILTQHIFQGFLEFKGSFKGTAFNGIILNIGFLLGLYFSSEERYYILGYGILLGYVLSFSYLAVLAIKNSFQTKINCNLKNEYLRKMIVLTLPLLLNSAIWEINGLVDKSISSTIGKGYISSLNYATYIVNSVVSIFVSSIGTVVFPKFVAIINENRLDKLKQQVGTILKTILLVTIPCTILLTIYSEDIVKVLFFRGEFSEEALKITSSAVSLYALGIVFSSVQMIMYKVFYAFQDTKTPTKTACLSIMLNITSNIIMSRIIGYYGIILSTVFSTIVASTILLINLNKKQKGILDKKLLREVLLILGLNVMLYSIIYILYEIFPKFFIIHDTISMIARDCVIAAVGVGIYSSVLFFKNKFKIT